MTTAVPQYHEVRITLTEIDALFQEYIGAGDVVDIGETLRIMLGDYFYGEPIAPAAYLNSYTDQDRTLVLRPGIVLQFQELTNAIDLLGDLFWSLADTITHRALQVTPEYSHRPNECFYKFFPMTRELVIYTPVLPGQAFNSLRVPLEGLAVIMTCRDTLPSWLRESIPMPALRST